MTNLVTRLREHGHGLGKGNYDYVFRELVEEAADEIERLIHDNERLMKSLNAEVNGHEPKLSRPAYDNLLKPVTSEWATEKNDMQMTVHHRMVEGVLCRWWGDGPTPDGVALIDAACDLRT